MIGAIFEVFMTGLLAIAVPFLVIGLAIMFIQLIIEFKRDRRGHIRSWISAIVSILLFLLAVLLVGWIGCRTGLFCMADLKK